MSQPHIKTALGEALRSLRLDEETYYDNLLEEARTNIEKLELKNIKLQKAYSFLRSSFCNSTYKVKILEDGYEVTSTANLTKTQKFKDLENGIAWAEELFEEAYPEYEEPASTRIRI